MIDAVQERLSRYRTSYDIAHVETFPIELGRSPRKVQNAYIKTLIPVLRNSPDRSDGNQIKQLNGYKKLWRIRVGGEYRLVYHLETERRLVTILMLDHRSRIYDRLGADDEGRPGIKIVAKSDHLLDREPTPEEKGKALVGYAAIVPPSPPPSELSLDVENLLAWGIPVRYHESLLKVRNEDQLIALSTVPGEFIERVMNGLWPPPIEVLVRRPVRIAQDQRDVEAAARGQRTLESFLLCLDEEQKFFVSRFRKTRNKGPWLLKGGPGSGKSTVALYCIHSLAQTILSENSSTDRPLKILFTTFTKSLANASRQLLKEMEIQGERCLVSTVNIDRLAFMYLPEAWKNFKPEGYPARHLQEFLCQWLPDHPYFPFSGSDVPYLIDEIEWVIMGQNCDSLNRYLEADRTGRGRALSQAHRRLIWDMYLQFSQWLRNKGICLFTQRLQEAYNHVRPIYDYVFIDEAQDLKPVAIRFCVRLCTSHQNVFLTADSNQSIYGTGLSWSRVATDLRFQGKARILKRNYRTTSEIWEAINHLAPREAEGSDAETLDIETVYHGPLPSLVRYSRRQEAGQRLNAFIRESLIEERMTLGCAAVLCPTKTEMNEVLSLLDRSFQARAMNSSEVDITYPGVKVLTMHAAKGLQFPIVAIYGVEGGRMPFIIPPGCDPVELRARQRRLLFVASSRAMRRLMIFSSRFRPFPFIGEIDENDWEIEELGR